MLVAVSPPTAHCAPGTSAQRAGDRARRAGSALRRERPSTPRRTARRGAARCTVESADVSSRARVGAGTRHPPTRCGRVGAGRRAPRRSRRRRRRDDDLLASPDCSGTPSISRARACFSGMESGSERGLSDDSLMPSAGTASAPSATHGDHEGPHRVVQRRAQQRRPHARFAVAGREPPEHRHPRPVDAPAELHQQRRQHGERTEHRHRDDDDRSGGERGERRVLREVETDHRHHDGEPGHQHGVPGGLGGDLDRIEL